MAVFAWIVLGLVVGFIASKIMNRAADGVVLNTILGLVGALAGGALFKKFGGGDASGENLYSILAAIAGAIVVLFLFHTFLRRSVGPRARSGWH
jgi:uncharacterized membrane protein YeaQ/YmgE (transglycosylase-associated protein family)